jgi:Amt family ammonium transporter
MANGLLAGLVAVTGAVPHVTWWGGLILGALGGAIVLPAYRFTVDTLKIDDVCGVFAVHGAAGALGTALIPVFGVGGFMGINQLVMQILGVVIIAAWTVLASGVVFAIGDALYGLRVSDEEEVEGLDQGEHGVTTYPEFVGDAGPDSTFGQPVRADGGSAGGDDE